MPYGVDTRRTAQDVYADRASFRPTFPTTHDEWCAAYAQRHRAYVGEPYDVAEIKAMGLFRAIDPNGFVLAETRRLTRDYAFVVDTDVNAIVGAGLSLEVAGRVRAADEVLAAALQVQGEAIWRRSELAKHLERWVRSWAVKGDLFLEAVLTSTSPRTAQIVMYQPHQVEVAYDETGTGIASAVVSVAYLEAPEPDASTGQVLTTGDRAMRTYVRRLTPQVIEVWRDGVYSPDESGPHMLGRVPLVHVPYIPYDEPDHGLGAGFGLDEPIALIDSFLTQVRAIGNRHANPILAAIGVRLADGSDILKLGRTANIPEGGDLKYIEADLHGVEVLLDAVQRHRETVRATYPEFLFIEAGANASGEALSYRASQFESKMLAIRARLFTALAEVTEMCRCLETRQAFAAEMMPYRVVGGPVLPRSVATVLGNVGTALDRRLMRQADAVAVVQGLGLVDKERDPAEYAASVATEAAELDQQAMERLRELEAAGRVAAGASDAQQREDISAGLGEAEDALRAGDSAAVAQILAALRERAGLTRQQ